MLRYGASSIHLTGLASNTKGINFSFMHGGLTHKFVMILEWKKMVVHKPIMMLLHIVVCPRLGAYIYYGFDVEAKIQILVCIWAWCINI